MGKIVLVGNPNCGKTSVFNLLTGLKSKVSNLSGTTVEVNKGNLEVNNQQFEIVDLPGTYSIYPNSNEEEESINFLLEHKDDIDLLVYVADANQLFRNFLFLGQLLSLKMPTAIIANMWDKVNKKEATRDLDKIQEELGIPILPFSARSNRELPILRKFIVEKSSLKPKTDYFMTKDLPAMEDLIEHTSDTNQVDRSNHTLFIYKCLSKLFDKNSVPVDSDRTYKWDKVLLHPIWGFVIFGIVMFLMFQILFPLAEFPMQAIDSLFQRLADFVGGQLPADSMVTSLIVKGIIPGIAGVVIFTPQIALLFLFLGILEDTGYVSRISFLMDSTLRKVGLNGKSVIPMVGGFACSIPAIMSARTIGNKKERLITMLITPLMACSARLSVYTVLISLLFVKEDNSILSQRGLVFFAMYMFGIVVALIASWLLSKRMKNTNSDFMVIEMPRYRLPIWRNVRSQAWQKTYQFIKGAGMVIFVVSIVLWFLASFGPKSKMEAVSAKYSAKPQTEQNIRLQNAEKLENSFAGHIGKVIEPAIEPLGYDWKIGIALITSFAAREVFVGTLSTIYAIEGEGNERIVSRLRKAKRQDGKPVYTLGTIISLLLFYSLALQCMSTLAVMKKETGTWKWPLLQFLYMGALAYILALIAYQTIV